MLSDPATFGPIFKQHVKQALSQFHSEEQGLQPSEWAETRITMLVNWDQMWFQGQSNSYEADNDLQFNVGLYVEALPPPPKAPVSVMLRTMPATMTTAEGKDSKVIAG
jgi:hypothetical protein